MSDFLSFRLPEDFIDKFRDTKPNWGFPIGGGNSLSEITFLTKYSRLKEDGSKERWFEVCRRCTEGTYSILKDHCLSNRTPWNDFKAQKAAQDAYERMFTFKWMPPGRGLWMMGTEFIHAKRNSAALQNCSFISTEKLSTHSVSEATLPFTRLMEMSMLGVGVGFDTRGEGKLTWHVPSGEPEIFVIPDSREGWCDSVAKQLESYFFKNRGPVEFVYDEIRPAGEPIKGFGGVAAGPQPLISLHDKIDKLYADRDGTLLSSRDIVDLCNLIARCVVSGNVRRSALIALGQSDDEDYLDLKNWELNPERMAQNTGWGHTSNNSVVAQVGGKYDHIVDRIAMNGEPGFLFLDLAQKYGRLIDPPDNKDYRMLGCNPCLTKDTWVMTNHGPRQVSTLIRNPNFECIVDGKSYPIESEGFFWTGNKDVYTLETDEGYSVRLTEDHKVLLDNGSWEEVGSLSPGDKIRVHDHQSLNWGSGSTMAGYVAGLYVGDGSFISGKPTLCTWGSSEGPDKIRLTVEEYVDSLGHRSDWDGWSHILDRDEYRLSSAKLTEVIKNLGVTNKDISQFALLDSETQRGFLSGLFDADGHVEGSVQKGVSIRLSQSDFGFLQSIQRMLLNFGVHSKIRTMRDGGLRMMPDGNGGKAEYYCKPSWRLIISGSSTEIFMERIGFVDIEKSHKFYDIISGMTKGWYRKPYIATFKSLTFDGIEDVYDVTVSDVHAFDANGLYVHNCAEQGLEHMEMCTLVETFPYHHDSQEDFRETLKHAYLYGKAVTLLPTHWPETNEVMQRNRRIGCSVSGLAQFIEDKGWIELGEWLDDGYSFIQSRDVKYSEWLGVRESIRMTTVKPSGTVSIVAGATPGVHWPVAAGFYIRRIRFSKLDPVVDVLREAGYIVEDDVMNPDNDVVVEFPTQGPAIRTEKEVSLWEKAELAVLCQRLWSDNMVSCTLTFLPEEAQQLPALIAAKTGQLKTMSMLPLFEGGAYPQMPYEAVEDLSWRDIGPVDVEALYASGQEAQGEMFCTTDKCEIVYS